MHTNITDLHTKACQNNERNGSNTLKKKLANVDFYVMRFSDKGSGSTTAADIKIINYI